MEGITNNKGGKETYIINIFNALDKAKYNIDFVVYDDNVPYEEYLKGQGANVYHLIPRHKSLFQHRRAIDDLFKNNSYDVVWAHKTTLSACEILMLAKKNRVPVRIVHSHSSENMGSKFTYVMHNLNKIFLNNWSNVYLACSENSAKWFYGSRKATIMTNGIELEKFKFNQSVRDKIRKQLNLKDYFVVGHIGRFSPEKNHKKLIDIFKEIKKLNPNVKLILCGDGEMRHEIEVQIERLRLKNDVMLLGIIDNVNEILQAVDVVIMPSLFEGQPFALLEAQAAGLKCVVSDTVSKESDVIRWNEFIPLNKSNIEWAEIICNLDYNYDRSAGYRIMKKAGFDIRSCVKKLNQLLGRYL